ncbi:MAG: Gfo/Idh/MocA family protein, partial [Planctomycetota bacterium]
MNQRNPITRRFILKSSLAGSAINCLPAPLKKTALAALDAPQSPNERIQLGIIGIGPRCTYDVKAMLPFSDVRCVAIADVQASRRDAGKQLIDGFYGNQDCKLYSDFRQLLDRKDIDAVLIATGDRWHAAASIMAAQAGKDVYSEKPCGITIEACQKLADTIHQTKRVFQAGTQRRSVPNFV